MVNTFDRQVIKSPTAFCIISWTCI